jgi:hypothetical protein
VKKLEISRAIFQSVVIRLWSISKSGGKIEKKIGLFLSLRFWEQGNENLPV